jgi:GDPmannose 4,6-dehydratase
MWRMLQPDQPDDYVVATGETHSIRELCQAAFAEVNLDYRDYVIRDERFFRPAEVDLLVGNAAKVRRVLQWEPKIGFCELIREMLHSDLQSIAHS